MNPIFRSVIGSPKAFRRALFTGCSLSLLLLSPLVAEKAPAKPEGMEAEAILGDWNGVLELPGGKLTLVFHIVRKGDGLSATLDSPDQAAMGIPAGEVGFTDGKLTVAVPSIAGRYEAKLEAGALDGTWSQGGTSLPLDLQPGAPAVAGRPQEPKPPFPYLQEEVKIANTQDGVTLAGTLTLPKGEGPFPAVVLVSGSGPQNRDEELMGHRPFLVLADALTRGGIAVLRYDDRGVGESTGYFATATTQDFATDTAAIVAWLEDRPEIGQIGIAGHSEGGLVAPMVATDSEIVDFLVLLAAPGLPGEEILVSQADRMFEIQGLPEGFRQQNATLQRQAFARGQEGDKEGLRAILTKMFALQSPGLGGEALEAQLNNQVAFLTSPWFSMFAVYDPAPALQRLHLPVLVLNGGKDVQVLPESNLAAIRAALEQAGNQQAEIRQLPGLNHLFQPAETGAIGEYANIETTFDEEALAIIRDWILKQGGKGEEPAP